MPWSPLRWWSSRNRGPVRRPTPPKEVRLLLESLEDRLLPSVILGVPRRPVSLEGAASPNAASWFAPAAGGLGSPRLNDLLQGSALGALAVNYTGSYQATITITGADWSLSLSADVSLAGQASGTVTHGAYTPSAASLGQEASVSFIWSSMLGGEGHGSTFVSTTGTTIDGFNGLHGYLFGWQALVNQLVANIGWSSTFQSAATFDVSLTGSLDFTSLETGTV